MVAEPSLAETNAFVAVLEQKSFTKAARHLSLSPPRVSEMVRQLEERLGVRLIERTTRSVAPTVAGERLLARLRPVLDDYRAALDLVNDFREKPAGVVRLTVAPPVAYLGLIANISRFLVAYPEISVELSADSALTDIVAGRFDAGIRHADRLERDMIAVRISDEVQGVTVAAPSYIARRGKPQTPHEVAGHDCIRIRLGGGALIPWRLRLNRRVVEVPVEGRFIVNDDRMAMQAVLEGVGLLQMPRNTVERDLAAKRLVTVLDDYQPPPLGGFFLYYPSRRQIRPALKVLVDFLRKRDRRP
ncbi:MAG: LysR family transcriptional regulator [Reyranella sp.]|nr:LysR family transcriptional regulator [Reyranella sp.]